MLLARLASRGNGLQAAAAHLGFVAAPFDAWRWVATQAAAGRSNRVAGAAGVADADSDATRAGGEGDVSQKAVGTTQSAGTAGDIRLVALASLSRLIRRRRRADQPAASRVVAAAWEQATRARDSGPSPD